MEKYNLRAAVDAVRSRNATADDNSAEFDYASQATADDNMQDDPMVEDSYVRFLDGSSLPQGQLAFILFLMLVMLVQDNSITDRDLETMMGFLNTALQFCGSTYRFPRRAPTFQKWCQLAQFFRDGLKEYAVCDKCCALHPHDTVEEKTALVGRTCQVKGPFLDSQRCTEPILDVSNKPVKIFVYNSIINTLRKFFLRENFTKSINEWKRRAISSDRLYDVYDGEVWKSFRLNENDDFPFVQQSDYNLMLAMNVDWLQIYDGTQHSSGAIYLTILNLPREERNKRENLIFVGLMPGPKEPNTEQINHYLKPVVDDLMLLMNGVMVQTRSNGEQSMKAALTSTVMDLPASRKCLGFTSYSSFYACHKCDKKFNSISGTDGRWGYTDLNEPLWARRTKESHRAHASEWLRSPTNSSRSKLLQSTGTRWTQLLRLPYFDPVRYAPIDVMHNCFLGIAKRFVCAIWRDDEGSFTGGRGALVTRGQVAEMSMASETLVLPIGYDSSAIARKMTAGDCKFSNMTADEWRVWIVAMSPSLLATKLDAPYLANWLKFVEATRYLCNTSITLDEINHVHQLLIDFLQEAVMLYDDVGILTINSHNLLHIKEGLLDYGPAMTHWAFNFERYNRDLKNIKNNKKNNPEKTITKKYIYKIHNNDYFDALPIVFNNSKQLRQLFCKNYNTTDDDEENARGDYSGSHFDVGSFLEKEAGGDGRLFGYEHLPSSIDTYVKGDRSDTMAVEDFGCLMDYYNSVYDGLRFLGESNLFGLSLGAHQGGYTVISRRIKKFTSLKLFANRYRSSRGGCSPKDRGSFVRAYCDVNPDRDAGEQESYLRPAQIIYFFCHDIEVVDCGMKKKIAHAFALVKWFKPCDTPLTTFDQYGSMETWSNSFEEQSAMSVVPIMRIHSPIAIKLNHLQNLNIITHLERHIIN